ncbi:hypothetical protein [Vibrio owensii]|uniref:hypothetical protein n=1 Tax=Vibrio owensii TaxID=696485 RepID=UPI003DA1A285
MRCTFLLIVLARTTSTDYTATSFLFHTPEISIALDSSGDCGETTTREVVGFISGVVVGAQGGSMGAGVAMTAVSGIALIIGVTASAPVLAIAAIGGAVAGGFVGGVAGSAAGKAFGDVLYEKSTDIYEWGEDLL